MNPKNKTRYKSLNKIADDPRVEEIFSEYEDGIWIYLNVYNPHLECKSIHEYTCKDLLKAWNQFVKSTKTEKN